MSKSEFQNSVKTAFIKCFALSSESEKERYLEQLAIESQELADAVRELQEVLATQSHEAIEAEVKPLGSGDKHSRPKGLLDFDEPKMIGPYKLQEKLGEGGMGSVYLAEQTTPIKRQVAVKIIKAGMDTEQVTRRFEAERQTLALMDHPNIARVLDAGATGSGRPYFVMELVEGVPLTEFCKAQRMPINGRLQLFVEVCEGVKHAHQKGVIHRDLKPSNVLVASKEGKPKIKIIDFGIAKAIDQDSIGATRFTSHSLILGTPLYMSPEQAGQENFSVDTRSDVYSLGVMLYELLTDTTPFSRATLRAAGVDEIRRIIREVEPEKPSQRLTTTSGQPSTFGRDRDSALRRVRLRLQGELDWIVMKALEKERNRRYDSPGAFADDIERYVTDRPVHACPPSWFYRCSKAYRKNRLAVVGAVALLTSLFVGLTSTTIQWNRAERLARQESEQRARAETLAAQETSARKLSEARLYASQINRAKTEWDYGNHIIAKRSLSQTDPALREWEYFLLKKLFSADSIATSETHSGSVLTTLYSKDGKQIVTGGSDGMLRYWDASTLQETRTLKAHSAAINKVLLTPNGQTLISGSADRTIKSWDYESGAIQSRLKHSCEVNAMDISADSTMLAFGGTDGVIRVVDRKTEEEIRSIRPESGSIRCVAFTADGSFLASGTDQNALDFWHLEEADTLFRNLYTLGNLTLGRPRGLITRFDGHTRSISSLAFPGFQLDDTGPIALSAGDDGWIKGWDYESGYQSLFYTGHIKPINDLQLGPNGDSFASASSDGTARLWRYEEGFEIAQFREHQSAVNCVAFNPDGTQIASGGADGKLITWSTEQTSVRGSWQYQEFDEGIRFCSLSPNGNLVLTAGQPKLIIWDRSSEENVSSFRLRPESVVETAWNPIGEEISIAYEDGVLEFVDPLIGKRRLMIETGLRLTSFSHLPNGDLLLVVEDRILHWTRGSHEVVNEWGTEGQAKDIWCNAETLAYVTNSGQIEIRTLANDVTIAAFQMAENGRFWLSASDNLEDLMVVHESGKANFWDVTSGAIAREFDLGETELSAVKIDLDAHRIFTGATDGVAQIWDINSGQYLFSLGGFDVQGERISSIDFSQDQTKVICAGEWGDVYTWGLKALKKPSPAH